MSDFAFAIPGDLTLPTGGYAYARQVLAALGGEARHLPLPGDFPDPSQGSLEHTVAAFAGIAPTQPILVDGLAFGALPATLLAQAQRRFAALVHHPLALESGLTPERADFLAKSERAALELAQAVIVTSPATKRTLVEAYDVDAGRITVALPGTEPARRAEGGGSPPLLLSVGALVPRKAFGVLVEALHACLDLDWRCTIVGATDRDAGEHARVETLIRLCGLAERIELAGAVSQERLEALYARADIFALPSLYEGYGMVFSEALSRGLPIVATRGGAIPDTVPADAGLLAPPGDAAAFAQAMRRMLTESDFRKSCADHAWRHGQTLPRWPETAKIIAETMKRLAP